MSALSFARRLMNTTPRKVLRKVHLEIPMPGEADLRRIPAVPLTEIVRSRPLISVDGAYSYVDGSLPWCDIRALLTVAADRRPGSVAEIGTLHGHTARLLAVNLPRAQVFTIDLPEEPELGSAEALPKDDLHLIRSRRLGEEFRSDPSIRNVTQLVGDTATIEFPCAELYYIDGSHTYEYARNDTEKALAAGARTVLWHDCDGNHPGVTRWLREMVDHGHPVRRIEETNLALLDRREGAGSPP